MSWIKVRENLRRDPAVVRIASRLSVTTRHAVGALVDVWSWAGALTADGDLPMATAELLDEVAGSSGFAAAMAEAGWLVVTPEGLVFPHWDRHNSDQAKERAMSAERQRKVRASRKAVTDVTDSRDAERDQRRGEEKREENTEGLRPSVAPAGAGTAGGAGETPPLPGIDLKPPKGKRKPTQNQVDGLVARNVWLRCWQRQFGRPYTDLSGQKSSSVRTAFVRLGRNEVELERLVGAFLAAPPFKCRENPDPIAFLDSLSAVAAGLNGKDRLNGTSKPGKRPDGTRTGEYPEPIVMPRRA